MRNAVWLTALPVLLVFSVGCGNRDTEKLPPDADGALMAAVRNNAVDEVKKLVALGVALNPAPPSGQNAIQSPLAIATLNGNLEVIRVLLDAGADPNGREYRGWTVGRTPLIIASGMGRVDVVTLLLQRGARVNLRGGEFQLESRLSSNSDALFHATAAGHAEAVRVLLLWGANSDRADLYSAISTGREDLVWLLLSADADPRWILVRGRSALEEADRLPAGTRSPMVATIKSFLGHDPAVGGGNSSPVDGPTAKVGTNRDQ